MKQMIQILAGFLLIVAVLGFWVWVFYLMMLLTIWLSA